MSNRKSFKKKDINDSIIGIVAKPTRRDKPKVERPLTQSEREAIAKRIERAKEAEKAYNKSRLTGSRISSDALVKLKAIGLLSRT
jgi:hypothetical protein